MIQKAIRRSFARILRLTVSIFLFAFYCTYAAIVGMFPGPQIMAIINAFDPPEPFEEQSWLVAAPDSSERFVVGSPDAIAPGLVLVAAAEGDRESSVGVYDRSGKLVHSWDIEFATVWPDAKEGVHDMAEMWGGWTKTLRGAQVLDDGGLVFTFSRHSTVRVDACGKVAWKLGNQGHDSVFVAEDGNFWVPAQQPVPETGSGHMNVSTNIVDEVLQEISPDGQVLRNFRILDLLRDNDYLGLIHASGIDNAGTFVSGDLLHLNDVELAPSDTLSSKVSPGDVLVSLQNINTLLVFDPDSRRVKFTLGGHFLRQNDPDLVAGSRILLFDNNNLEPNRSDTDPGSRIVSVDLETGERTVLASETTGTAFYSPVMGQVQSLPNGNLLIVSSLEGRVMEVTPAGETVWRFTNLVTDGKAGIVTGAQVLPADLSQAFFREARQKCAK